MTQSLNVSTENLNNKLSKHLATKLRSSTVNRMSELFTSVKACKAYKESDGYLYM